MLKYISIEGVEGAGKSTGIKAVLDHYKGFDITSVREPGGTWVSEKIRNILKGTEKCKEKIDPYSEALLFFAARNQLLTNVVAPALKENYIVVSDRCYLSSIAYQRKEPKLIRILCDNLKHKPNLIIYMDIDPALGMQRVRGRGGLDRIEKRHIDFFKDARKAYLQEAKTNKNIVIIDASKSIDAVYKDIQDVLHTYDLKLRIEDMKIKAKGQLKNNM